MTQLKIVSPDSRLAIVSFPERIQRGADSAVLTVCCTKELARRLTGAEFRELSAKFRSRWKERAAPELTIDSQKCECVMTFRVHCHTCRMAKQAAVALERSIEESGIPAMIQEGGPSLSYSHKQH